MMPSRAAVASMPMRWSVSEIMGLSRSLDLCRYNGGRPANVRAMLRPATSADRPHLIALAFAEDAAWSGAPAVSEQEAGEFIDALPPGVIFERDGRVAGYAS